MNDLPPSATAAEQEGSDLYRTMLESSDQGYCTIEVAFDENEKPIDYRFLEVSLSFEGLTGIKNAAGRWMREIAPDQDQFWFDVYGRVARTGEPQRFENSSTPLDRWFSVYAFKIDGAARIAVLFDDITERRRAEMALRRSEEQFQALFDQAPLGIYLVDSDFVVRQVNPVALPVFGDIRGGPVGRDFDEVIHILWDNEYADEVVDIFRRTLETGESYFTPERAEYRADRDAIEYYEWRLDRILLPAGQFGVVCYFRDISAQVNARKEIEEQRESARESGERYHTLFEAIDSGFCILEMIFDEEGRATDYRFVEANPAFERQSGLVGAVGHRIREFAPDLEEHWFERYGRVALTGESMRVEGEVAPLGRWFDINAFRVGDPEQRRVAVLFTDITARRDSEQRQRLLLAELQHRVRNILAMIRSVTRRTAETSETVQDYAQHLEGRINAMARTQALLTRAPGSPVDLENIVRSELLSVVAQENKVWCEGPAVHLEPKAAEVFTLAIHELATNAVKYGAFSQAAGQLEIGWKVEDRGAEHWLHFFWEESRVEGVQPSARKGFGTELITRRVPYELGGSGTYELKPGGICVEIAFPLRAGSSVLETRAAGIGGA